MHSGCWGVQELEQLKQTYHLSLSHSQAVVSTYSSAKILVEAMRLSGRGLDRKKVTAALEKFYQFDTGLTPPITYTKNRRVGAKGAYIYSFNPQMKDPSVLAAAEWIDLN